MTMKPSLIQRFAAISLAFFGTCSSHAAEATSARPGVDLVLQGTGPFHTLRVPMNVQSRATAGDLADLQVVNASGDAMPFAWVEALPGTSEQHQQLVPIFKLPGAASGARTLPPRSWMLDARRIAGSLLRIDLALADSARGVYTLAVETSHDMKSWRLLHAAVQVLSLEHQGQRLVSTVIDLGGVRSGYIRLTAAPDSLLPELQSAQVTSVHETAEMRPLQWSEPIASSACGTQQCDYRLPKNVPLEQVEFQLMQLNTLARVQLLGEEDAAVPPEVHQRRQLLRNPIKVLRRKSEPASAVRRERWDALNSASLYWIKPPEGEVRSGPIRLGGGLYSTLRVQTNGPIGQLGSPPPSVRVGAHMPMMVFLARAPGPYRLVWGDVKSAQSAVGLSQLMPQRKSGDALPPDSAEVAVPAPAASVPLAASAPATAGSAPESKPVWLWAVLLAGLSAMGFMAWSLLRKTSASQPSQGG